MDSMIKKVELPGDEGVARKGRDENSSYTAFIFPISNSI